MTKQKYKFVFSESTMSEYKQKELFIFETREQFTKGIREQVEILTENIVKSFESDEIEGPFRNGTTIAFHYNLQMVKEIE